MSQPIYVRHISGQGKMYKVEADHIKSWLVHELRLPKEAYVVCEPPEQWEDVTSQCDVEGHRICLRRDDRYDYIDSAKMLWGIAYRLRKVPIKDSSYWAFIVERQVKP